MTLSCPHEYEVIPATHGLILVTGLYGAAYAVENGPLDDPAVRIKRCRKCGRHTTHYCEAADTR